MPRYQLSATVPAGTPESDAVVEAIEIEERWVQEGFLYAPPGAAFSVNAELRFGERRLLPTEGSDPTTVPEVTDPAPIRFAVPGVPNELTMRVWSPDAEFQHTVKAVVDVVEIQRANPLQRLVGRLTGEEGRVRPADGPPEL